MSLELGAWLRPLVKGFQKSKEGIVLCPLTLFEADRVELSSWYSKCRAMCCGVRRHGWREVIRRLLGTFPWRCKACGDQFYLRKRGIANGKAASQGGVV